MSFLSPCLFHQVSCLRSNSKYYETQSPIDALTSEDDNDIISEVPPQGDYSEESDIIDAERSALLAIVTEPFRINSRHPGLTTTCYHYLRRRRWW